MFIKGGKREVAAMAWPMAVGMLSFTLMSVTDILFMGMLGTDYVAGVGLATTLAFFFMSFFIGLVSGPQSLVSAADGAGDAERKRSAASAGIIIGAVSGVVSGVLMYLLYLPLTESIVSDPAIIDRMSGYLQVRVLGMPFAMLGMGLLAGIQGIGDSKTRMWVNIIANLLNIALNALFIFGFGPIPAMKEAGAALATILCQLLTAILYYVKYRQHFGKPVLAEWEVIRSSLLLGLPSGMQRMLGVFAFTVMSLVLGRVGAGHLAASEIVLNIVSVSFLPGFGISEAGGILVGRYLGAGDLQAAGRALRSSRILAGGIMAACGVLFAIRGEWLAALFTNDPTVAAIAGTLMLFAAFFQVFDALSMVHLCALRGAGDTRFALIVTTGTSWGLTVPLTLLFALWMGWGAPGAYLALSSELLALALISGIRAGGIEKGRVGRLDLLLGREIECECEGE